ncbi:MAG: COQ9 family protein [Alphaproteobacteria bacterium]|nr:MAG: COQ9 family protein [Alphaproteobacteria bacterium]
MVQTKPCPDRDWPEEDAILEAVLEEVPFEGWTAAALRRTERRLNLPAESLDVLYPDGLADLLEAWAALLDRRMAESFPPERLAGMRVRERIAELVFWRIGQLMAHREAVRRLLAHAALPAQGALLARRLWRTADTIWWLAGDQATDINYYTKRAILAGVMSATLLAALDDGSPDLAETRAFLERRIADVMRFEKIKAGWREQRRYLPSLTRFLGRLRYPPERF